MLGFAVCDKESFDEAGLLNVVHYVPLERFPTDEDMAKTRAELDADVEFTAAFGREYLLIPTAGIIPEMIRVIRELSTQEPVAPHPGSTPKKSTIINPATGNVFGDSVGPIITEESSGIPMGASMIMAQIGGVPAGVGVIQ